MAMTFDKGMDVVKEKFAALNDNQSFDWTGLIGPASEVLIPLIQDCLERRRANGTKLAARTRKWGLRESAAVRLALRKHDHFRGNEELIGKMSLALKDAAQQSRANDLREFFESAGE